MSISRSIVRPLQKSVTRSVIQGAVTDPLQELIQQLFGNGEQGAFYLPQPVVNGQQVLFQDAAGTIPVTADGDPVGLMKDLSGNGHDLSQTGDLARPLYRSSGGEYVEFNGTSSYLVTPSFIYDNPPMTVSTRVESLSSTDTRLVSEGYSSSNAPAYSIMQTGNNVASVVTQFLRSDDVSFILTQENTGLDAFDGQRRTVEVFDDGLSIVNKVDGVEGVPRDYTRKLTTLDTLSVGAFVRVGYSSFFDGHMFALCITTGGFSVTLEDFLDKI